MSGFLFQRRNQRAFTLIELIVVIAILIILFAVLIVSIMTWLARSKESATETTMQDMATAISELTTNGGVIQLISPKQATRYASGAFIEATRGSSDRLTESISPMQRSKLLAWVLAPTQEQWSKIIDTRNTGGSMPEHKPLMAETTSKSKLTTDNDGFNFFTDGWGNPISIEFNSGRNAVKGASQASTSWVLVSGGEDGDMDTNEDNMWHASNGKAGMGDWADAFSTNQSGQ